MKFLQLDPMNWRNFYRPGIHQSRIVSSSWEETKNLMTEHLGAVWNVTVSLVDPESLRKPLCSMVKSVMSCKWCLKLMSIHVNPKFRTNQGLLNWRGYHFSMAMITFWGDHPMIWALRTARSRSLLGESKWGIPMDHSSQRTYNFAKYVIFHNTSSYPIIQLSNLGLDKFEPCANLWKAFHVCDRHGL